MNIHLQHASFVYCGLLSDAMWFIFRSFVAVPQKGTVHTARDVMFTWNNYFLTQKEMLRNIFNGRET